MKELFQQANEDVGNGKIHVVGINKGGAAKTTTAVNMGVMLSLLGCRTLVIDCAPEAHTTYSYGYLPDQVHRSLYELLSGECSLKDIIVPTYYNPLTRSFFHPGDRIDPANPASETILHSLGEQVIQGPDLIPLKLNPVGDETIRGKQLRELLLTFALRQARKIYSDIICDTNPDLLNLLTANAIYAADFACIPFIPEQLTAIGFKNMRDAITQVQKTVNPKLQIAGVLMAKVKPMKVHRDILDPMRAILEQQGIHYFRTEISDDPHKFLSAANRRSVIVLDDPLCDPAFEYWSFLAEYVAITAGPAQAIIGQTVHGLEVQRQRIAEEKRRNRQERAALKQSGSALA